MTPGGFKGIVADSMDARGVALVHGKLAGQVELNVPQATFCITVKNILDIFPNVHPQHFLDIYRLEGSTDITLYIYEPSIRTTTPSIQIKTLARSIETLELNEMDYSYYVEIELAAFRNALKTAKSQKATIIQLCVYEIPRAQGGEKTIFFVVKYTGEQTSSSFPYESRIVTTGSDKGPITIKALEGGGDSCEEEDGVSMQEKLEEMVPSYQGNFLAEYLYLFVKSMDRFNITLRLKNERNLNVDYQLGCSATDGLRYVLAPTTSIDLADLALLFAFGLAGLLCVQRAARACSSASERSSFFLALRKACRISGRMLAEVSFLAMTTAAFFRCV